MREALAKAAGLRQASADTERQIREHDSQAQAITTEQSRIRDNIKTVDRSGAYGTRLLQKLDDQETQLDKLRTETDALRTKLDEQRKAYSDYLNGLTVG